VVGELPEFEIHRRLRTEAQEKRPAGDDIVCYSLPKTPADVKDRAYYWIAFEQQTGFEPFRVKPFFNNQLTIWALFKVIAQQCAQKLAGGDYWFPERGFIREIHFNMRRHDEGDEQLIVQPYYMRVAQQFGVL